MVSWLPDPVSSMMDAKGLEKFTLAALSVTSASVPRIPPAESERNLRFGDPNVPEPLKSMLE